MDNLIVQVETFFKEVKDQKVVIVGDVMLDTYLNGTVDRISPEAPVPVVNLKGRKNMLGGAANVALNIKKLEAEPVVFSVIGTDKSADAIIKLFEENNISTQGLIKNSNSITTTKIRIVSNKVQLLRVDEEKTDDIPKDIEDQLISNIQEYFVNNSPKAILLQDYNKGVLTANVIKSIGEIAAKYNVPVAVDPKKNNFLSFKNVTLFKPNLKEISEGLSVKINPDNIDSLASAAMIIHDKLNVKNVLITLSEKGSFVSTFSENKQTCSLHPTIARSISDVSGAGDTVISVATLGLIASIDFKHIAVISNIAGGLVCQKPGVVPISKKELIDELHKNNKIV